MGGTFSQFMEAIRITESQGLGGYQADNGGHIGAYQMGVDALISTGYLEAGSTNFSSGWTGKNGINSKQDFKDNPSVQDSAIQDYWLNTQWKETTNRDLEFYAGQTLNGYRLTISGMIAASHLVGSLRLAQFIRSGGTDTSFADGNGTLLIDHLRNFADYSVPAGYKTNLEDRNIFKGGIGNDGFVGKGGNDVFLPGAGNDEIWGGEKDNDLGRADGTDTVDYTDSTSKINIFVNFNLPKPVITVQDGMGGTDVLHSVEKIIGTAREDKLQISGTIPTGYQLLIDARGGQNTGVSLREAADQAGMRFVNGDKYGFITNRGGGTGFIALSNFHTDIEGSDFDDDIVDESSGPHKIDGGAGNDHILVSGPDATIRGGAGDDAITLKSTSATVRFGAGDGADVVDFGDVDGDYRLQLDNINMDDIELLAGGRDLYYGGNNNETPDGFWYQFLAVRIKSTGETITFLENGKNVGPDGNGSATAYNKALYDDPTWFRKQGAAQVNQGKLDSILFADGSVLSSDQLWHYIRNPYSSPINVIHDFWSYTSDFTAPNPDYPDPNRPYHTATTYVDYVNQTYLRASPIESTPPPPNATVDGTPDDDSLAGGYGDDTITGGLGDDSIKESPGDDTYRWNIGDGNDSIIGSGLTDGFNTLALGAGIAMADLRFAVTSSGTGLIVSFVNQNGSIAVEDFLVGEGLSVDQIKLFDGSALTRDQIIAAATTAIEASITQISGTSGADYIFASGGNFIVNAGQGNDQVSVNGPGAGTFIFSSYDGHDQINDYGTGYNRNDLLKLTDVLAQDVQLTRSGDALILTTITTGASISINAQFGGQSLGETHGVSAIEFADGSIWNRSQIRSQLAGGVANISPIAHASIAAAVEDGKIVRGTLAATDPDTGDTLTFTLDSRVDGLAVSANGDWSFNPMAPTYQHLAQGEQLNILANFHVTDSFGASSSSNLAITLTGTNDSPVVTFVPMSFILYSGMDFDFQYPGMFNDPDGDVLTLSALLSDGTELPDWLVFSDGRFSGIAPAGDLGIYDITVTASDGSFLNSSSFQIGFEGPLSRPRNQSLQVGGEANEFSEDNLRSSPFKTNLDGRWAISSGKAMLRFDSLIDARRENFAASEVSVPFDLRSVSSTASRLIELSASFDAPLGSSSFDSARDILGNYRVSEVAYLTAHLQ